MAKGKRLVIDVAGGNVVTRRATEGKEFVTGTLGWEVESVRQAIYLDGEGKNVWLAVY